MNRRHFRSQITAIGFLVSLLIPITSYSGAKGDALLQGIAGALDGMSTELARQAEIDRQLEAEKKLLQYRYELERARIEEVERKHREEERTREAQRREQERQAQLAAERQKREADEERKHALVTGTGFFVAPNGYLITNHHVIEGKTHFAIRDHHGDFYRAEVIAQDANRDLALLRVQGAFPSLKIVRSDTVSKGQRVMAVGYPQISIQGNESKVTDGVISSFSGVNNDPNWFQISAPIQGGNSGGPLVTESGQVVGVVVATANVMKFFRQTGNIPQNVNYAIKANVLLGFLTDRNISNVATTSGRATIDAVDRATVLVVAKAEPIDVIFSVSPEQRAAQEREKAKIEAEEMKQRRLKAEAEKRGRALAKAEQRLADQRAREEAARIDRRDRDIGKAVPDWREIEQSEVFVAWLQIQPTDARERLGSVKAPDVIAVFKRFQAERRIFSKPAQAAALPKNQDQLQPNLPSGSSSCTYNDQCPGSNVCIGSPPICQLPYVEGHACSKDFDCAGGLRCAAGRCAAPAELPSAALPKNQDQLQTSLPAGSSCTYGTQCAGVNDCIGSPLICQPRFVEGHVCSNDMDCAGRLRCAAGRCASR